MIIVFGQEDLVLGTRVRVQLSPRTPTTNLIERIYDGTVVGVYGGHPVVVPDNGVTTRYPLSLLESQMEELCIPICLLNKVLSRPDWCRTGGHGSGEEYIISIIGHCIAYERYRNKPS